MTIQYDAVYQPVGDGQGLGLSAGVYAWSGKPPANSVPIGTTITIRDFSYSEWYSDGSYWRPCGNMITFTCPMYGIQTNQTTLAALSNMPSYSLPFKDFLTTPGCSIETFFTVYRANPSSAQQNNVSLYPANGPYLVRDVITSTAAVNRLRGIAYNAGTTTATPAGLNEVYDQADTNASNVYSAQDLSPMTGVMQPLVMAIRTGATDGSETLTFSPIVMTVRF